MDNKKLEELGWIIECESPLEIRHEDGSFATGNAAKIVYSSLTENNEIENSTEFAITELNRLLTETTDYIHNASVHEIEHSEEAYKYWEIAYSLVFNENVSKQIYKHLRTLNIELDYYDPDTSYEEDVKAFHNAFQDKMNTINVVTTPRTKRNF